MNVLNWFPFAFLADTARPFHNLLLRSLPSSSVCFRSAAFPSWVSYSNIEFRLPFSHAGPRAERLDGMEVSGGSAKFLEALGALLCDLVAPIKSRLPSLGCDTARERAKLLVSFPCTGGRFTTCRAERSFRSAPAIQEVTRWRTKYLFRSTIVRMKGVSALLTVSSFFAFHAGIITHLEEKYCEIAVKRLGQQVLALTDAP